MLTSCDNCSWRMDAYHQTSLVELVLDLAIPYKLESPSYNLWILTEGSCNLTFD